MRTAGVGPGLPANGESFPDGSKVAKIECSQKQNTVPPYFVMVPDAFMSVSFIEHDTKRFSNTHGWAYARFDHDPATKAFWPSVTEAECHSKVAA
jgi:hypothetical protein